MDSVVVETVEGVPVSFVREGRTWRVGAQPVHWFERVSWWLTATRAPKGAPFHIDVEVWQVQARLGRNERSPLVTFELVLGQDRETWTCRSMVAVAA